MNFIYELSQIICTQENTNRAREYLISRKIDPDQMKSSCVATGSNEALFARFSNLYPTNIFIDSLYIPIVDVVNPQYLVGFDVKYLGTNTFRTRFHKFKILPDTFMLYFSKNLNEIEDDEPLIVTEAFIDALTLEQMGYTVVSPLTALNSLKFCLFLYSISNRIFIMYDNDSTGRKATQKLMQYVSMDMDLQKSFNPVIYTGKDANAVKMNQGGQYLEEMLKVQIGV